MTINYSKKLNVHIINDKYNKQNINRIDGNNK